ncbi:hypothetical protein LCGC14_1516590, partial [marine sediment metagenome]
MPNKLSYEEEAGVEEIATNLFGRLEEETDRLLKSQLTILGVAFPVDKADMKKFYFPDDELALCRYEYKGKPILGVR